MEHHKHVLGDNEDFNVSEEVIERQLVEMPDTDIDRNEVRVIEESAQVSPLSQLELAIAEEKLNNISNIDIAKRLGISGKVVRIVLGRKHVKEYINDVFESVTAASKEARIQLMAQIIENKMQEEGVTSNLDLAQLIQIMDGMGKLKEQTELGAQNNVMINILNAISKDES